MSEETQLEQSAEPGELAHYQEQESVRRPLTVDKAYEEAQERKDRANDEAALAAQDDEPEQPESAAEDSDSEDGAVWSNEDMQTAALLQQEAARFQQDLAAFAQAKQVDLNEIAKKDKPRAAALRTQMHQAEQELRQRHEALTQLQQELEHKAANQQTKHAQKVLQREKEKLSETVPNLDKDALTRYLTSEMGFTRQEVSQAYDHRLVVMAEKARRYDELMADKKGKKVPKLKKGAKRKKQEDTSQWHEAMDEINRTGITKDNAHRALHSPAPKKREPTVKDLRRRLKKTGSINDAYELLQAKKRA